MRHMSKSKKMMICDYLREKGMSCVRTVTGPEHGRITHYEEWLAEDSDARIIVECHEDGGCELFFSTRCHTHDGVKHRIDQHLGDEERLMKNQIPKSAMRRDSITPTNRPQIPITVMRCRVCGTVHCCDGRTNPGQIVRSRCCRCHRIEDQVVELIKLEDGCQRGLFADDRESAYVK